MRDKLKRINKYTLLLVGIAFVIGMLLHLYALMVLFCIGIVLFIFLLYVNIYPKAYFIEPKSQDDYRLPWIALVISLVILVFYTGTCNFDTTTYFLISLPISLFLILVFVFKTIRIKSIDAKRSFFVFLSIITISLCITVPLNTLFPIVNTSREKVQVLSKNYANVNDYEKTFALYLKVGNTTKKFNVSKQKYKNIKEDDYVLIEKQTNIFGMIFYKIY